MHPAFDQIMNELTKFRFRSGGHQELESVIIRAPYGAVGHGGLYHSQSPEAHYCIPGVRIFVPSNANSASILLKTASELKDPTIIFEPKLLYRQPGISFR
jgi:2-oxoisovalerate dehydrogenase E1 component beta subunit